MQYQVWLESCLAILAVHIIFSPISPPRQLSSLLLVSGIWRKRGDMVWVGRCM